MDGGEKVTVRGDHLNSFRYQTGTTTFVDGGEEHRAKFEVGRLLRFLGYAPGEIAGRSFEPGDLLRPVEDNPGGMGIDVQRDGDGLVDMVWPEEVELVSDEGLLPDAGR
jgi:hypothetical protein